VVPAPVRVPPVSLGRGLRAAVLALLAAVAASVLGQPAGAQGRHMASRASLEALARAADSAAQSSQAGAIRARLTEGDFAEGDRIYLLIEGDQVVAPGGVPRPAVPETLQVRAGRLVDIRNYPPLPLAGVLRSELRERVDEYVRRFLTNPTIRVAPLMRIGVLGSVARPSYYHVPPDALLSDAIRVAGGYAGDAAENKISVRREGKVIRSVSAVRTAIAEGNSLDAMGINPGDEIFVERRSATSWLTWAQVGLGMLGVVIAITRGG
jgi:hypothetical protein